MRVTPGAIDFGFIGRGEIASKTVVLTGSAGTPPLAQVLPRGDWLRVERVGLDGDRLTVTVTADPQHLGAFWDGSGIDVGRLDGWLEVIDGFGSTRVPAGAILRRDRRTNDWWNPFARRVS